MLKHEYKQDKIIIYFTISCKSAFPFEYISTIHSTYFVVIHSMNRWFGSRSHFPCNFLLCRLFSLLIFLIFRNDTDSQDKTKLEEYLESKLNKSTEADTGALVFCKNCRKIIETSGG